MIRRYILLMALVCSSVAFCGTVQPAICQEVKASSRRYSTEELVEIVDGRASHILRLPEPMECSFSYPNRPTLQADISGHPYALLLDSGTRLSILNILQGDNLPTGLFVFQESAVLADLDGGRALQYPGHTLAYAEAGLLRFGEIRIRRLPMRVYSYDHELPGSDYQGSLSLLSMQDWIIEVDNDDLVVRLHLDEGFKPAANSAAIPLLRLHDLLLLQAGAGDSSLLLVVDTGFSGELLLTGEAARRLGNQLTPTGELSATYQGYHDEFRAPLHLLDSLTIAGQPWPGLAERRISLQLVEAAVLEDLAKHTALGRIDGIIGAGLLSRYNYTFDLSRCVLFLEERK